MQFIENFKSDLLQLQPQAFEAKAMEAFQFQSVANPVYHSYINALRIRPETVKRIEQIPFLPIGFFKEHRVVCEGCNPEIVFESSGTTGSIPSRHYVADPAFYLRVAQNIFERFYGPVADFHILALLPSYLERSGSSLVYMAEDFIKQARPGSGFFLHNHHELAEQLRELQQMPGAKVLLLGVTFALLDFADYVQQSGFSFPELIVMETGGMKGRRREYTREELHEVLKTAFGVPAIHAEYGMTELLSQCYARQDGLLVAPPWVRVQLREINDPFSPARPGHNGAVNLIDLANIESCCFIETADLGRYQADGTFRIMGRLDHSDLRGCNLMVS